MKILLVITNLGVGGAERLVTSLADRFAWRGHEVVIAYLHGPVILRPRDSAVRLIDLKMSKSPVGVLRGFNELRKLVVAFEPDVVNAHLYHASILSRVLRIFAPLRRLVTSAHSSKDVGRLRMLVYRITDALADISTNVSNEAVHSHVEQGGVRRDRMVTVLNGLDTQAYAFDRKARERVRAELGISRDAMVLLAIGRLDDAKDYPNLLEAFATLQCGEASVNLLIAGDGPLKEKLSEMVRAFGLEGQVNFLGIRHDVVSLLSACDLFVLSSAWEGLPMVILEAMACERPIVATNCGGVGATVGDSGFLVTPGDSRALAGTICRVLTLSQDEKRGYGVSARKRVIEHFSLDATVERYLGIFQANSSEPEI